MSTVSQVGPPYGPGNETCGPLFGRDAPQFHVMDLSCAENDPNGPFYDPKHGVYHLFHQDALGQLVLELVHLSQSHISRAKHGLLRPLELVLNLFEPI